MRRRRKSRTRLPFRPKWSCAVSPPPSPTASPPGRVPQCSTRSSRRRASQTTTSTWMRVCRPNSAVSRWTWPVMLATWALGLRPPHPRGPRKSATTGARARGGGHHVRALRQAMTTRRATAGVWTKTQALVTAGTGGTAVRGRLAAQGATGEAAARGRVNLPEREGEPLDQTGGVLLEGAGVEEEGMAAVVEEVGEEEGVTKDRTAPPVVVTTVAPLTPPSTLCPARPARPAAALSWWRAWSWWVCASALSCSSTAGAVRVEGGEEEEEGESSS